MSPGGVLLGESLGGSRLLSTASAGQTPAERVAALLERVSREPEASETSHDALAELFREFDGEGMLMERGVLAALEPHAHVVVTQLCAAFQQPDVRARFSVAQCANILSTTVLLGHYDTRLKDALIDRALEELPTAPRDAVGSLCYAMGLAGYSDVKFTSAVQRLLEAEADAFSRQALAKCVWMFGRLNISSDASAAAAEKLARRVLEGDATPADVVWGVWACQVNDEEDEDLTDRLLDLVPEQLGALGPGEIAKLAIGLARAQVMQEQPYLHVAARARELCDAMSPRDIAKLLYALGQVQVLDKELLSSMEPQIERHLSKFTHNELDMITSAYNSWGYHNKTAVKVAEKMTA